MTGSTRRYSSRGRGGFTLVELLVVIGIIVLLVSIVTPMVMNSRRSAARTRTQADLNTIALGLEQYKKDFGDYPRPDLAGPDGPDYPVLAWALLGPWQAVQNGADPGDGADGMGFRTQWDPVKSVGGRVFGPYIAAEKFKIEKVAGGTHTKAYLQDQYGSRIEYLPQWRKFKPGMALFGVPGGNPMSGGISTNNGPSVYDCRQASAPEVVYYLQRALGDTSHDDKIASPEQAAANEYPPFLLMAHTKDFSPQKEMDESFFKVTEVSNFPQP
jgi:prepilin-type N-terminal cleavage/methylation domain-containing protein